MNKLFILNLIILTSHIQLLPMQKLSKNVNVTKSLVKPLSIKVLAYKRFGLENWMKRYCTNQLKKIYLFNIELYHSKSNLGFEEEIENKLHEIVDSYDLIERHQNMVQANKMYEPYVMNDSEFKEILELAQKEYNEWKLNLETQKKEEQESSYNIRKFFRASFGLMVLGAGKFIFDQTSNELDETFCIEAAKDNNVIRLTKVLFKKGLNLNNVASGFLLSEEATIDLFIEALGKRAEEMHTIFEKSAHFDHGSIKKEELEALIDGPASFEKSEHHDEWYWENREKFKNLIFQGADKNALGGFMWSYARILDWAIICNDYEMVAFLGKIKATTFWSTEKSSNNSIMDKLIEKYRIS